MEPIKPMEPTAPPSGGQRWWPEGSGQPASSGARGGTRHAFFPDARRSPIERDGKVTTDDGGARRSGGVSQGGRGRPPPFTDQDGPVRPDEPRRLDRARGRGGAGTLDGSAA